MPSNWAEVTRTTEYRASVEFNLAETPGKLVPHAIQDNQKGELIQLSDMFNNVVMRPITGRNSQTNHTDMDVTRRWLKKPVRSGVAIPLDPDDQMATKIGIRDPLPKAVAIAGRQYQDDQWLVGYYSPALTGPEALTSVPFKASNILAADHGTPGTNTGLTLPKLTGIRKLAKKRFVNTERGLNMIITAEDFEDLMGIEQFVNADYNNQKRLENGEVTNWMGFNFIPAEIDNPGAYPEGSKLAVNSVNGARRLPVWVDDGMFLNKWLDFIGYDDTLPDMNHSEQFAGYSCVRATRTNEDKCFVVEAV